MSEEIEVMYDEFEDEDVELEFDWCHECTCCNGCMDCLGLTNADFF